MSENKKKDKEIINESDLNGSETAKELILVDAETREVADAIYAQLLQSGVLNEVDEIYPRLDPAVIEVEELEDRKKELREYFEQIPFVIIMDDEIMIVRGLKRMMDRLKRNTKDNVQTFTDPRQALEVIADLPPFSVIISDNNMGLNSMGFEGRQIAKNTFEERSKKGISFIIHSGDSEDKFKEGLEEGYIDAFFDKGFSEISTLKGQSRIAQVFLDKVIKLKKVDG
ncbi:response regulator [Candidatus Peregrinibacteria bacterium]|nr:response regulator [Candidatus Peregrinibacteria bacterium]